MSDEHPGHGPGDDAAADPGEYCREVEAYLCRKNDGHLIRIAGPSFSRVSGWAQQGIPLNVVYRGVDRYFERYYARGQRRRPVHIDFCEGDVLTVFDEWRRAVRFQRPGRDREPLDANPAEPGSHVPDDSAGSGARSERAHAGRGKRATACREEAGAGEQKRGEPPRASSLAAHLERVIVRLTTLRAGGRLTLAADAVVAAAIRELDAARGNAGRLEADARTALVGRLRDLDAHLLTALHDAIGQREQREIEREAQADLAAFRAGMAPEAYERAIATTRTRVLRQRTGLPIIAYEDQI